MALRAREQPEFETPDHRQIFEYVERHGRVRPQAVATALKRDPERFHHELAILKRDGYLEERDGELCIVLEAGTKEEHTSAGVDYVIRPARQADLSGIVGTIHEIAEEQTYLVAETVGEELDHEGALIRHNEIQTRMFFVATVAGDVIGWTHLEAPELEKLSHAAKLTVGVLSDYRHHGIGGHLLERGINWAANQGYLKAYNSIPATNEEGARFLAEHGFDTEAIRPNHYRIDDEFVDEIMMARTIQPFA